jgi:hypothetical protein
VFCESGGGAKTGYWGGTARARGEGLSLDEFAARALEAVAKADVSARKATPDERVKAFEEFLAGFESDAVLPEEAFQRENWYPDHS